MAKESAAARVRGRAGYIAHRKNLLAGNYNVMYWAKQWGLEANGPYLTVCEAHGATMVHKLRRVAFQHLAAPATWCSTCGELNAQTEQRARWREAKRRQRAGGAPVAAS